MGSRSPVDVSLYIGLATVIGTFAAAAVALGLLRCTRARERAASTGVLLFATVGIAASLVTIARARTSGAGNLFVAAGVLAAGGFVLTRALRTVFSSDAPNLGSSCASGRGVSTRSGPVRWTDTSSSRLSEPRLREAPHVTAATSADVLRRSMIATVVVFAIVVVASMVLVAPDFLDHLFQSRPVGRSIAPAPDIPETTGGVAHTWTDSANAGGTQGPSIASNQTVKISCRLVGFVVADGNNWWYRIKSAPWSDKFYVSADAFYNNGSTAGALHATPFFDVAVPRCGHLTTAPRRG